MKQSIFARVAQLAKANLNAVLDSAEDPQKMLDQMVRDYSNNIREAEAAIAQTIGNLRMAEDDHKRAIDDAHSWGNKAIAASRKADEFRAAGNSDADKFDALARLALQRQMTAETTAKAQTPGLAAQNEVVDKLKSGLDQMRGKLGELTAKRNELVNRARVAATQSQVNDALKALDTGDPASAIGRYEENIRRQEATVRGQQELAASSLDAQFDSLEDLGEQTEVEARLAALKSMDRKALD
ncbi:phage shock protein A, PspA [Pseudarthrobacter chlorophenolicus A6]|uniref:Phage shock protein A, PspA n=1 Tax=Pseudarthrobacter chlorophenolicus (strain ATCC 700700 / DSM 12829 / CIP 107037 / JCM 12360 / KCTC 9906 / NCIMB 13794 / A6) TaxID=452863 RepID=B8H9K7_PSECP|nr:PspA/IM30 family protein [Pseudarthrobacter chlorophenolicus]ACL40076.1 phage shock protein A, PspA [Pseudarthrobacter chlorophenolicus A6]SDQ88268.1 phage shock protein A (PspA) family protein [Pseudarthrobacter chlorophenolicus]